MSNDDFDEEQDQKPEERLPITPDLIFMRYKDGADEDDEEPEENKNEAVVRVETHGFVFFYPQLNICKVIEADVEGAERAGEL